MPYIKDHRSILNVSLVDDVTPINPGELNYVITTIVNNYWKNDKRYQTINDILGALDGASKEFYRRVAVPYEDTKIAENGDVY